MFLEKEYRWEEQEDIDFGTIYKLNYSDYCFTVYYTRIMSWVIIHQFKSSTNYFPRFSDLKFAKLYCESICNGVKSGV